MAKRESGADSPRAQAAPETPPAAAAAPAIRWDDTGMSNSYANVCNVIGTREEVALFFGMSIPPSAGGGDLSVALSQRILLNPYAAKRLAALLNNIVSQYEERWGALGDAAPPTAGQ